MRVRCTIAILGRHLTISSVIKLKPGDFGGYFRMKYFISFCENGLTEQEGCKGELRNVLTELMLLISLISE